ncbi:hypothetical protein [Aquimarina rhabdastrellae]
MKTDQSKHHLCIAAIKRSTFKPYDYKLTRFYEANIEFLHADIVLSLSENELIICATIIDRQNYSILTTQKLVTRIDGQISIGNLIDAKDKGYGLFKATQKEFTFGSITLKDGRDFKYFIETGKASMIMIYGVRTLLSIQ